MSCRAQVRRLRRMFLILAVLGGSSVLAAACSSGATSSSGTNVVTASINLAPFEQALQADYEGHFTAPPTTAPPHQKGVNLWIISCGQASEGCAQPSASAKEAATVLGWKATVFDGDFGIGDAYDNGIRDAIADHAQAIIVIGVNCNQAKSGFQAAKAAGIIVVGSNSYDCNDPEVNDGPSLFTATVKYTPQFPTAGANQYELGVAKADWIIVHTKGHALVVNTDFEGLTGGIYMNEGFDHELAKCTTCKILKTVDYTPETLSNGTLKQEWASALAQYPQANAGEDLSDSDIDQAGMAQAIQSAGRTKTFALVGTEGFAQNITLIRDQDGEAAAVPDGWNWLAWGAVDTVLRLLDHQPTVYEGPGPQVVDATHNLPPVGQAYTGPVDYQALYEKAWGV
jgi:ribose transport system substrate-binding protein